MNTTSVLVAPAQADTPQRLPLLTLILLAVIGFVLVAIETMPAGLLPVIASGMGTTEGTVGLFVSAYALGTVVVTVPAIALTRGLRRKPLILAAIAGLILSNTATAFSTDVTLSLVSRFVAGAFSGTIWGMLAAYGRRISPPRNAGLSLAIVSAGAPVGFALGTPLGSWLGMTFDWRWSFIGLSLVAFVAAVLIAALAPDAGGQGQASGGVQKLPLRQVFRIPGIAIILAVILTWMLAHNTLYTYISPYLRATSSTLSVDVVLLVFGIASLAGVVTTGAVLDRGPRPLLHTSVALFIAAGAMLLAGTSSTPVIVIAAVLWGITFGGASAQLQAALTSVGGENADVANSFLPVAFNIAIFIAGILGASLLTHSDGLVLPVNMIIFGGIALLLTIYGRRSAFRAQL